MDCFYVEQNFITLACKRAVTLDALFRFFSFYRQPQQPNDI